MVTELVKFNLLETVADELLFSKADHLNDFQKAQEGFCDVELVKNISENTWCFIYHYDSLEKVKVIGEKLRSSTIFDEFNKLIVPGSLSVTFHQQLKKWQL